MQRPDDATLLELISISEAARIIGINKSTLSRQMESGQFGHMTESRAG